MLYLSLKYIEKHKPDELIYKKKIICTLKIDFKHSGFSAIDQMISAI